MRTLDAMGRLLWVAAGGLCLAGCALTVPVEAVLNRDGATMRGTATGYPDKTGHMEMSDGRGVHCLGDFEYTGTRHGRGSLVCNDGRVADIQFVSVTNATGYGYGVASDGTAVRFVYGMTLDEGRKYFPQ